MAELDPTGSASTDVSSDVVDSGFDHLADERNDDALGLIDDALSVDTPDNVLDAEPAPEPKSEQREGSGAGSPGGAPPPSPPVAQTTPTPPADSFQAVDFRMAKAMGISFADMRAFGSVDAFRQYVNEEAAARQFQQQQAAQQQRFQVQPFQMENPDQYDPQVVAMNQHWANEVARLQQYHDQRFEALQQQYGGLQQQVQKHLPTIEQYQREQQKVAAQQAYSQFDSLVNSLPEELVGRGNWSAVDEKFVGLTNPQHIQARKDLHETVMAFIGEKQRKGEVVPPIDALMKRAFNAVFGDQLIERERAQLTQKLKARGRNTLAVPSQALHQDDAAAGEEKAKAIIEQFVRSH